MFGRFEEFKNCAFDITGYETENFETVASIIRSLTNCDVHYESLSVVRFYIKKRRGYKWLYPGYDPVALFTTISETSFDIQGF